MHEIHSLTNYRGGEQGKMEGLKQNELHSEMSSILMPFVAHQTVTTLLLSPASSGCSDCYCHPSLHSLSYQIIIFTLFSLPRPRSILFSSCSFNYFSFLCPLNFTGLLPDLQLSTSASTSAFKLTILSDLGNRGPLKNGFLSVLDSSFSSCFLCLF